MILLYFQIFSLVRKKCSTIFFHLHLSAYLYISPSTLFKTRKGQKTEKLRQKILKRKKKVLQKKKLIDTLCEKNISTVAEELVFSENIASSSSSYTLMISLFFMMDEVYH